GGRIVVAGTLRADFAVVGLRPDGTLDPAFDGDGRRLQDFGRTGADNGADAVAVQPDGKAIVVGRLRTGAFPEPIGVARLNVDGTPDTTFGGDGLVTLSVVSTPGRSRVALQADG